MAVAAGIQHGLATSQSRLRQADFLTQVAPDFLALLAPVFGGSQKTAELSL